MHWPLNMVIYSKAYTAGFLHKHHIRTKRTAADIHGEIAKSSSGFAIESAIDFGGFSRDSTAHIGFKRDWKDIH